MTEPVQVALIISVASVITAALTVGLPLILAHRKLDHIAVLTNSKWDEAQREITKLKAEIAELKRL